MGTLKKTKLLVHLKSRSEIEIEAKQPEVNNLTGLNSARSGEDKEKDACYTRASILMVVVFVLCHSPRLITNTLELFVDQADLPAVSCPCPCSPCSCNCAAVRPDWAIYCTLGNFSKPMATIILPILPTF